jgi:hypothetical protein
MDSETGTATLRFLVGTNGLVSNIDTALRNAHPDAPVITGHRQNRTIEALVIQEIPEGSFFAEALANAVPGWIFRPAVQDGAPVGTVWTATCIYRLVNGPAINGYGSAL